jgi:hypothetical protein
MVVFTGMVQAAAVVHTEDPDARHPAAGKGCFSYVAHDNNGGVSAAATVNIN